MLEMGAQRKRGRPRRRWLDDVNDITGLSLQEANEAGRDQCKCRQRVMEVTRRPKIHNDLNSLNIKFELGALLLKVAI